MIFGVLMIVLVVIIVSCHVCRVNALLIIFCCIINLFEIKFLNMSIIFIASSPSCTHSQQLKFNINVACATSKSWVWAGG